MTTANGTVQLGVERWVRGRVMAIYMAIFMGGTVVGAPVIGWIANTYGPRMGLLAGAAAGFGCALIGVVRIVRTGRRTEPADGGPALAPPA
jgi:MFS family permease